MRGILVNTDKTKMITCRGTPQQQTYRHILLRHFKHLLSLDIYSPALYFINFA